MTDNEKKLIQARRAHLLTTHCVGGGMAFGHRALCEADAAPAGACRK